MKKYLILSLLFIFGNALADVSGVANVTDGDTLEIGDLKIRLNGIDAPESRQTCQRDGVEWLCGAESAKMLRALVRSKDVVCKGSKTDRYGRLIADCFVDRMNLNAVMVEEGMALAYRKYSREYVPEENKAQRAEVGLWSGTFVAPWDWRKGKRLEKLSQQKCCRICKKSKACGDSCIKKSKTCNKPAGCACDSD